VREQRGMLTGRDVLQDIKRLKEKVEKARQGGHERTWPSFRSPGDC